MKVKCVTECGREDVYNMVVDGTHNYAVNGGLIVHNCDALRAYAIYWSNPSAVSIEEDHHAPWPKDLLEDYQRATPEVREYMEQKYGKPRY